MNSKKFVSLYFSTTGIQIIQLHRKSQKVKLAVRFDLPEGVIVEQKVKDHKVLSRILKELWKKYKIKEKSVGVVVPEFSTFTKTLQLPHLEKDELDEAVNWQSQEFLPWSEEETILDWKIISEGEKGFEVLLIAINKKVLAGFIDSVGTAGLFPIIVETPSLSLSRLSTSKDVGKVLVYIGLNKSIVVVAKGEQVFGSSVHDINEVDELIETAVKMIAHYKDVKIESIELGGQGVTSLVVKQIANKFNVKPIILSSNIKKIPPETLHQYLIPYSLQLIDPSEPVDMYSINLIPEKWVNKYQHKKLKLQIWSLTLLVSYIVWISFFAALSAYLFMGQQIQEMKTTNSVLNTIDPETVEVIAKIKNVNLLSEKVLSIESVTVLPQLILNDVYNSKPDTISLDSYFVDLDVGEIKVGGVSQDRESLLLFKQNLEKIEKFSIVEIPIASLEIKKNIEFILEFRYLPLVTRTTK